MGTLDSFVCDYGLYCYCHCVHFLRKEGPGDLSTEKRIAGDSIEGVGEVEVCHRVHHSAVSRFSLDSMRHHSPSQTDVLLDPLRHWHVHLFTACHEYTDQIEIFQNAARTVYSVNLADIQEKTRGTSTLAAGYNASLQNVVTVFMVPAIGLFFDKFGWRMPFGMSTT